MATGEQLRVGVIMGSDSDRSTMRHTDMALLNSGLVDMSHFEDRVVSAHRTAPWMNEYARTAADRGLQVIIPGAGGSAALPGMVASETILPVAGVAVTKSPNVMNRALGSTIGMPEGKPLATFQGEDGAHNAGLFAARILGLRNSEGSRVGILMDSDADYETMQHVGRALSILGLKEDEDYEEMGVSSEADASTYLKYVKQKELGVIVVSSPDSISLAPAYAAYETTLPILGVALPENPDIMSPGLDLLVNSPAGEPLAAFQSAAGAFNAGLMAARILALQDPNLKKRYEQYDTELSVTVMAKDVVMSPAGVGGLGYDGLDPATRNGLIAKEIARVELGKD